MSFVVKPEAPKPGEALPEIINDENIEKQWAGIFCTLLEATIKSNSASTVKAFYYAETHFTVLSRCKDLKSIHLTRYSIVSSFLLPSLFFLFHLFSPSLIHRIDDEIYTKFRETFPKMRVDHINDNEMKSAEGKAKWAPFMLSFKGKVMDFNYLTLIRLDSSKGYSEENTTVGMSIYFLPLPHLLPQKTFKSSSLILTEHPFSPSNSVFCN